MINESNYHIYLDDFVNGLLDEEMELAFVAFLDQHPGILDGEELMEPSLSLDESFKAGLKKPLVLDATNTDEWLIASLEGDLKKEEEQQLGAYLQKHPKLEKDRELFALTVLKPDMALVFPHKEKLRHHTTLYLFARWSPAVAAALLLTFLFFRPSGNDDSGQPLAGVKQPVKAETPLKDNAVNTPLENEKASAAHPALYGGYAAVEVTPNAKMEVPTVSPKNIDASYSVVAVNGDPSRLPVEERTIEPVREEMAMSDGQSIWQWGYKKIRKSIGAEEIVIPERQIPEDALNLVLAKVVPAVQYDQDENGRSLRIGSFEINRKTARQ